jgi:hypothetical protein
VLLSEMLCMQRGLLGSYYFGSGGMKCLSDASESESQVKFSIER